MPYDCNYISGYYKMKDYIAALKNMQTELGMSFQRSAYNAFPQLKAYTTLK